MKETFMIIMSLIGAAVVALIICSLFIHFTDLLYRKYRQYRRNKSRNA